MGNGVIEQNKPPNNRLYTKTKNGKLTKDEKLYNKDLACP